MVPFWNHLV